MIILVGNYWMHNKWFGYARMCPQLLEFLGIETLYERLCTGTLSTTQMRSDNQEQAFELRLVDISILV